MFWAAASALNGVPSVNFTSVRSLSVITVLSLFSDHSVASHGSGSPVGLRCTRVS